jgi:hypothetical protein
MDVRLIIQLVAGCVLGLLGGYELATGSYLSFKTSPFQMNPVVLRVVGAIVLAVGAVFIVTALLRVSLFGQ